MLLLQTLYAVSLIYVWTLHSKCTAMKSEEDL